MRRSGMFIQVMGRKFMMRRNIAISFVLAAAVASSPAWGQEKEKEKEKKDVQPAKVDLTKVRAKALGWLTKNQNANGSWGTTHSIPVTAWALLDYLALSDEPFDGEH